MRLLILEDEAEMGGVQHSTINFMLGLKSYPEVESLLLLPSRGPMSELCDKNTFSFSIYFKKALKPTSLSFFNDRIRVPNILGLLKNRTLLKKQQEILLPLFEDFRPDIVLTKGMGAHINGGKVCSKLKLPCIWHLQDQISPRYFGLYQWIFKKMVKKYASATIADGGPIKEMLTKEDQAKCALIFNGVSLEDFYKPQKRDSFRHELGIKPDTYVLGNMARLSPWKGQHLLLEAFAKYQTLNPNSNLVLIGSPLFQAESYEQRLKQRVKELNLEKLVHFLGYRTDVGYVLSGLDLFVYPSVEKDTSPLSLISALAAGLPTAVSNISGLTEMVEGAGGSTLFTNRSVEEMIVLMQHFEKEDSRKEASELNRKWAKENFSINAYTKSMLAHLIKYC